MSPGWAAEWRIAARRRRLLALNVAVPLLLVVALVAGDAPTHHAAAVVAVLFTVFGVFGSAVPLVRDGDDGLLTRWILAGAEPRRFLAGRLAAQSLLDFGQLLPAALLVSWPPGPELLASLLVTLVVANVLGAWVAALARSLAEAALFGAVAALLLLHLGGVFRTPAPGTWQHRVEALVPFRLLHESLLAGGGPGSTAAASWAPALLVAGAFLLATWTASGRILRRLSAPGSGIV